jgi:hypothetical protein
MSRHLIPSAATLKAIKPGRPQRRLSDGAGLYLLLFVKGGSHGWRLDYSFKARRKTFSLGTYPTTSLGEAGRKAEQAREQLRQGIDPGTSRKRGREAQHRERTIERLIAASPYPAPSRPSPASGTRNISAPGHPRTAPRSSGDSSATSSPGSAPDRSTASGRPSCCRS